MLNGVLLLILRTFFSYIQPNSSQHIAAPVITPILTSFAESMLRYIVAEKASDTRRTLNTLDLVYSLAAKLLLLLPSFLSMIYQPLMHCACVH
jgi:replication-associated recombination protein RarA